MNKEENDGTAFPKFLEENANLTLTVGNRTLNVAESGYAKLPIEKTKNLSSKNICNSHNLTSAQESVQDSALLGCNLDLTSSESQKLMNTAVISSPNDIQTLKTTATSERFQNGQNADLDIICTQEGSTLSQLVPPALHSPQKVNGLEQRMTGTVSPQSSKLLENCNPNLLPLKTLQDSSTAPTVQAQNTSIFHTYSDSLPSAGTMRNGLLSAAATLPVPSLESEYCWLRSPGALSSTGKGRPPGQTKQEAELKGLGLINKGEVLNPAILCQWYEIPESWLDPSESRAATELLEINARQQEIFSILESQPSHYSESSTSTHCLESQQPVTRANGKTGTYIIDKSESLGIIKQNLGFGFVVDWLEFGTVKNPPSGKDITYNWERDTHLIAEIAIAPQSLIDKFLEECLPMQCTQQSKGVRCPSCESPLLKLDDGCGVCGWIPENFLEEKREAMPSIQQPKPSKQKGCLYKYIENKKLKDGSIVSYPRVIGHREPENPNHWRWGFNWEEKIDGEWKGRSINSIPVGAIPLIKSMQKEGVPLKEIIGFIKRAKSKKS